LEQNTVGQRIFRVRKKKKITRKQIADFLDVHETTIKRYEDGTTKKIPTEVVERIAKFLNVSIDYLTGWEYESQSQQGLQIPVLGTVAAGIPISAVEDILDYEEVPQSWESQGEFFGLRIKGDSMEPRMESGDVVIVRQQSDANSGDTVIVLVNGDDATCKRLQKTDNGIMLVSTNPKYPPMFYSNEDIRTKPVVILGKVVELRQKY